MPFPPEDPKRAVNLNCLRDDPLMTESFPYACLTACGVASVETVNLVCERYGLAVMESAWPATLHLHTIERSEAQHKRQAVVLMFAGIELLSQGGIGRAYLHEVSRLHELMAKGIGIDHLPYIPDGKIADWLGSPEDEVFTLDEAVSLHLRQAGFPVASPFERTMMRRRDVAAMAQDLIHEYRAKKVVACTA